MKYSLVEVEVGPHYLTFYVDPKPQGLHAKVYKTFCRLYPELAEIQQKDFTHEPGDIPVYHSTGCPKKHLHKRQWRHFHIRFGRKPTKEDLSKALKALEPHCKIPKDYVKCELIPPDSYPETPDNYKDYLEMIDKLRGPAPWQL